MKRLISLLLVGLAASLGWAQPVTTPEERRAALRSALQAQRRTELPPREHQRAQPHSDRRLSERERADLRQQLRQQRLDNRPDRR